MKRFVKDLAKFKLYFLDLLILLSPLLQISISFGEAKFNHSLKLFVFSILGIWLIKSLIPLLYSSITGINQNKFKKGFWFYLRVIPIFILLVIVVQLLKQQLQVELGFSLYLIVLFLTALCSKFDQEQAKLKHKAAFILAKYITLTFYSFFIFSDPQPVIIAMFSFALGSIAAAFELASYFDTKLPNNFIVRLPGFLYLFGFAIIGTMSILPLLHSLHMLVFFLVPAVSKITPSKNQDLKSFNMAGFKKLSNIIFFTFVLIMILVSLLQTYWYPTT